ncbi:hypothetical protein LOOC260_117620 [Paucilactobacillus hokkaidonensis JCM 18461]|uniref:YdhG-like domain-containing protein n=2 Tax=Paucilactobacillus hokkaidonensis TaxID=1193095 RepID=A0A0A1GZ38_9LACO|nr:iron chaperone [Paucilactobacillus hokkaidonensis]KRO10251.1 hypothetical protein IV59_GL002079 [Paucilactobacillus hokkaidonensis]BAP86268.1 hypothetical protein LOOC260_117620 [Paucilactobacillus hokkaidonensis JCM 18461]
MDTFAAFIEPIENPKQRARVIKVLQWVMDTFPQLKPRLAWNQPMFTDHGTFIIGFSISKKHMAATPEEAGIAHFTKEIEAAGIDHTKGIIRMPWNQPINYEILQKMIAFNIQDKAQLDKFWR